MCGAFPAQRKERSTSRILGTAHLGPSARLSARKYETRPCLEVEGGQGCWYHPLCDHRHRRTATCPAACWPRPSSRGDAASPID